MYFNYHDVSIALVAIVIALWVIIQLKVRRLHRQWAEAEADAGTGYLSKIERINRLRVITQAKLAFETTYVPFSWYQAIFVLYCIGLVFYMIAERINNPSLFPWGDILNALRPLLQALAYFRFQEERSHLWWSALKRRWAQIQRRRLQRKLQPNMDKGEKLHPMTTVSPKKNYDSDDAAGAAAAAAAAAADGGGGEPEDEGDCDHAEQENLENSKHTEPARVVMQNNNNKNNKNNKNSSRKTNSIMKVTRFSDHDSKIFLLADTDDPFAPHLADITSVAESSVDDIDALAHDLGRSEVMMQAGAAFSSEASL